MELQEIEVVIEPDGQVRLAVRGARGRACLDRTRELERVLGGELVSRELTPEAEPATSEFEPERERERRQPGS